jgi:hypothetical protein
LIVSESKLCVVEENETPKYANNETLRGAKMAIK